MSLNIKFCLNVQRLSEVGITSSPVYREVTVKKKIDFLCKPFKIHEGHCENRTRIVFVNYSCGTNSALFFPWNDWSVRTLFINSIKKKISGARSASEEDNAERRSKD